LSKKFEIQQIDAIELAVKDEALEAGIKKQTCCGLKISV
jgi:hypothetical protein